MKYFSVVSDIETGVPLAVLIKSGRSVSAYGINEFGKDVVSSSFKDGDFCVADGLSKSAFKPMTEKIQSIFDSSILGSAHSYEVAGKIAHIGKSFSERVLPPTNEKTLASANMPISKYLRKGAAVEYKAKKFVLLSLKSSVALFAKANKIRFNARTHKFKSPSDVSVQKIEKMMSSSALARLGRDMSRLDSTKAPRRARRRAVSLIDAGASATNSADRVSTAAKAKYGRM
jgi:hypothetical protein